MPTDPARTSDVPTPAESSAGVGARRGRRWLVPIGVGILLVVLLRVLVVQSYRVPTSSMEPAVAAGDRVVVTKIGAGELERGDVIVFDGTEVFADTERSRFLPGGEFGRALAAAASTFSIDLGEQDYLKRVAATGGEVVACSPKGGLVVDGDPVAEPWLPEDEVPCSTPFEVQVPPDHLFVLGDNRSDSADSRSHLGDPGGGMVPVETVIGHVSWRYWPLDRWGSVD